MVDATNGVPSYWVRDKSLSWQLKWDAKISWSWAVIFSSTMSTFFALDVRMEFFCREWGNQAEMEMIDLLACFFERFPCFFDGALGGCDADDEKVCVFVFAHYAKRFDRFGNACKFAVALIHLLHAVALAFCRFAEYIVLKAGGEEHAIFNARNGARGNAVFCLQSGGNIPPSEVPEGLRG